MQLVLPASGRPAAAVAPGGAAIVAGLLPGPVVAWASATGGVQVTESG